MNLKELKLTAKMKIALLGSIELGLRFSRDMTREIPADVKVHHQTLKGLRRRGLVRDECRWLTEEGVEAFDALEELQEEGSEGLLDTVPNPLVEAA